MTGSGWIILTVLLGIILNRHHALANKELWKSSCPFTKFCTTDNLSVLNTTDGTKQPCCSQCSCADDCWIFNHCCPDVTHTKPEGMQTATCSHLFAKSSINIVPSDTNQYRVLDFCPRDYDVINQHVIDQCEERISDNTTLLDVAAVSDSKHVIYKNKHCALCHGVTDVKMWDLRLTSCKKTLGLNRLSSSQYTRTVLENCIIESIPSSAVPSTGSGAMLCGQSLIASCSASTQTDAEHAAIREGCINGPEMQYVHQSFGALGYHRYKNVFCYLCRQNVGSPSDVCPGVGDFPYKSTFISYSVMLDMSLNTNSPSADTTTVNPCEETEVLDPVKMACVPLFCPSFSVLSFGQCVNIGTSVERYFIFIRIQYEPIRANHTVSDTISKYDSQMTNAFLDNILGGYGLGPCKDSTKGFEGYAFIDKSSQLLSYVILTLRIQIDVKCQLNGIVRAVRRRLSKYGNITVAINDDDVPVSGRITFFRRQGVYDPIYPYDPDRYARHLLLTRNFDPSKGVFLETGFFLCPYIVIDVREYNSFVVNALGNGNDNSRNMTEITESTRVEDGFYIWTEDSLIVCLDTYSALSKRGVANKGTVLTVFTLGVQTHILVVLMITFCL